MDKGNLEWKILTKLEVGLKLISIILVVIYKLISAVSNRFFNYIGDSFGD